LPCDDATVALYAEINDGHWKRLEKGETTRDRLRTERFGDFFRVMDFHGDPARMANDYEESLSRQRFLLDGALELIQGLYGLCGLYVVTNGLAKVQKSRFGGCPLAHYFDSCFISEEMGCAKPEKRFFDQVAAAIPDFEPAAAIVIGDSLSSDIQGGVNAGLDTCWYNPANKPAPPHLPITYTVTRLSDIRGVILGA
jgi:2-haloacid dehalogenase